MQFFISWKRHTLFLTYLVFHILINHSINFESCDMMTISMPGKICFGICLFNHKSFCQENWSTNSQYMKYCHEQYFLEYFA